MLYALFYTTLVLAWFLDLISAINLPLFSLITAFGFPIGNIIFFLMIVCLPSPDTLKEKREKERAK